MRNKIAQNDIMSCSASPVDQQSDTRLGRLTGTGTTLRYYDLLSALHRLVVEHVK